MSKKMVVPSVFTAIDKFSGPVNKMSKKAETSMDRMERKWRKVGNAAFDVSKKSAMIGTAIIAPMGILANEAVKFEEKMSNVSTLVDTSQESMEKMGDQVLDLATKLPVPIDELTTSLYDIRSAGVAAEDAMATLEFSAKLASAGLSSTEEATNIMTSAMNAFSSEGLTSAQIADMLFKTVKFGKTNMSELAQAFGSTAPMIQSAGVKLADFQAATAALTTTGTPASQAQNQLRASIVSLQKPTKDMEKVFKSLGVTSGDELVAKYGNLGDAFAAVNQQTEKLNLNNAKTWGSTEALAAVTSLTGATNEAYVSTLDEMVNGTNALNDAFEKQASTGKSQMQIMKNNFQSVAITLGQALLPIITDIAKAITPMVQKFGRWAKRNKGLIQTIMKVAAVVGGLAFAVSAAAGVVGIFTKAFGVYKALVKGWNHAVKIATAVQAAWNAMMALSPLGAITLAAAAAGAAIGGLVMAMKSQTREERLNAEVKERALSLASEELANVTVLFQKLRMLEAGTKAYADTLAQIEQIQPGITEQYQLQTGAIENQNEAYKALTKSIWDKAVQEAKAELAKEKIKEAIELANRELTGWEEFNQFMSFGAGPSQEDLNKMEAQGMMADAFALNQEIAQAELEEAGLVDPGETETEINRTIKENKTNEVTVKFENAPPGTTVSGSGGQGFAMPNTSSTR